MADWTEKYRPSTLTELRGNNKARDQLREWAETWDDHQEAVILHGSPGVGKTSGAHALANDMGWSTIELNASDQRTKAEIERVAGSAAMNQSLTAGGRQLVIVDEADNIHGNADRGGTRAITSLVKRAKQPIVLIANEFYEMSNALRNATQEIEFRDVSARSIVPVLRDIARKESIDFESEALESIAEQNSGDLRGAIHDLQAATEAGGRLTEAMVVTADRDRTEGIFQLLDAVLKDEDAQGALEFSYSVDETPDDMINWIEDNLPAVYTSEELTPAYRSLSAADRWLGRVRATQNYSFWRYASDAMTAGVAAAREEPKGGWTRFSPPSYWSKLGRTRSARSNRDYVAQQIATSSHVSVATARKAIVPYLETMIHHCKPRELTVDVAAQYDFEAEHVALVTGSGKSTKKVQSIVEDAAQQRAPQIDESVDDSPSASTETGDDGDSSTPTPTENGGTTASEDESEEDDEQQTGLDDFL
ncbi:replication factor C large subunit [Halocatena halophila]|uniref:replication factor C large subunit n=1 Tax=Halocatena halophila TaxID=2814576 RepID=UPI002ED694F2